MHDKLINRGLSAMNESCSPSPVRSSLQPPYASPLPWLKLEIAHAGRLDASTAADVISRFYNSTEGLTVRVPCFEYRNLSIVECIERDLAGTQLTSTGWLAASLIRHDVPTLMACGETPIDNFPPDCLDTATAWKWHPAPLLYVIAPRHSACGWPHDGYTGGHYHKPKATCMADKDEYAHAYEAAMKYWCAQKGGGRKNWRWAVSLAAAYAGTLSQRPRGPCLPPLPV